MNFYYFSIFSLIPLSLAYGVLFALLLWLARLTRGIRMRGTLLGVLGAVFAVLPIAEELWIAWEFAESCKQAGLFVKNKVEVDGFYDGTRMSGGGPLTYQASNQMEKSGYSFLEMKSRNGFVRFQRVGEGWTSVPVSMPTARYWYTREPGHGVAYKVHEQVSRVVDRRSNEDIARFSAIHREAPWFFLSIGRPNKPCPSSLGAGLVYREALIPAGSIARPE